MHTGRPDALSLKCIFEGNCTRDSNLTSFSQRLCVDSQYRKLSMQGQCVAQELDRALILCLKHDATWWACVHSMQVYHEYIAGGGWEGGREGGRKC